ncbi:RNA polymerase sigma factor [Qipengyuania sp. MTN3-11]|uniref:RNA polymerase sigma factor n=1 Tax=Qipengyuania sp. MTN3-11 TaxID=3056557 RepID=UPI0036F2D92B
MDRPTTSESDAAFDALLVTLVWSGDRQAARRLAVRWQPRLLRTARRLLQDPDGATSAVQDSWVAIFRGIHRLDDPARFAPWAFGILRHKCLDRIRTAQARRGRSGELAEENLRAPGRAPEERLAILQAFAALPGDQRLAAHLHYTEGLTLAEIAAATGAPEGTVKSRLFNARRRLKAVLQGDDA